jgi:predicted double-glycine peptidase
MKELIFKRIFTGTLIILTLAFFLSCASPAFAADLFKQDIGKSADTITKVEESSPGLLLVCDCMHSVAKDRVFLNKLKAELEKKGKSALVCKYHSIANNHILAIKNCPKGYWVVYGACLCSGTWRDLNIGINNGYLKSAWKKNEIKGLVFVNLSSYMIKNLTFLKRAWDDNFSPASFKGIDNPYKYLIDAGFKVAESPMYNKYVIDERRIPYLADEIIKAVGGAAAAPAKSGAFKDSSLQENTQGIIDIAIRSQFASENGDLGNVSGGPASLGMIMEFYGVKKSTPELAKLCQTRPVLGTGFNEMAGVAKSLGFDNSYVTTGRGIDWLKSMTDAGKPVIVHVDTKGHWPQGHYMVATGVKDGKVFIADPWTGHTASYSITLFKAMWASRQSRAIVISKSAQEKAAAKASPKTPASSNDGDKNDKKTSSTKGPAGNFPSPGGEYLKASSKAPSTNTKVVSIAKGLRASTAKQTAVNVFKWVRSNVKYSYYSNSLRGALKTISGGSGNCCDQASVAISLLRAAGVPARYAHSTSCRFTSGLVCGHVWAEAYIDGKWQSLDTTSSRNSVGSLNSFRALASVRHYVNVPF